MRTGRLALLLLVAAGAAAAATKGGDPMKDEAKGAAAIEVLDEAMKAVVDPDAKVRLIAEGLKFTEGPVWLDEGGGRLLFSDIPADTIYRWTAKEGLAVFRRPSHGANGNTLDREGRLVTCEHTSRSVTRTEKHGRIVTLAAAYGGKRLNSPNDVVVRTDGTVWFTDPPYGIRPEQQEQPANYVFRLDPGADAPAIVADDFARPNGLAFSPDEKYLYIADSDVKVSHVRRFRVAEGGTLADGTVLAKIGPPAPDGVRCDREGRLYVAAGDGIHVLDAAGKLLGKIRLPQRPSNCEFGGPERRTLFITAREKVYAVDLRAAGGR
jgi:gluconolactonase